MSRPRAVLEGRGVVISCYGLDEQTFMQLMRRRRVPSLDQEREPSWRLAGVLAEEGIARLRCERPLADGGWSSLNNVLGVREVKALGNLLRHDSQLLAVDERYRLLVVTHCRAMGLSFELEADCDQFNPCHLSLWTDWFGPMRLITVAAYHSVPSKAVLDSFEAELHAISLYELSEQQLIHEERCEYARNAHYLSAALLPDDASPNSQRRWVHVPGEAASKSPA